ncbi:MAG: AMIN domain-containing protein [candidate division Zixibacteria bacterium]|nr:AMIN domain-containing protein [candidate division Zixibacteria bacterium]
MKTNKLYLGIFLIIIFFLLIPFALLWAETQVQNITLQREGEYTNVTIFANAPFQFNHFIEEKKEGKPYRVVIDCLNAVNSLPQKNFQDLPQGIISSIRTSQYQTTPDKVCRIVLDLKSPVVYKVVKGVEDKVVILAFSTPQEPTFQTWSTAQGRSSKKDVKLTEASETQKTEKINQPGSMPKKEDKVVLAAKEAKPTQKTEVKPVDKAKAQEKPSTQSQKETKPVTTTEKPKAPEPAKTKEVQADTLKPVKSDTLKKEAQTKMPGKVMEETPKRELLVFHSGQRKDPFSPLTEKRNFELGSVPLPSIEELKLVGILEDNSGFKALLENELGYGYILQAGDRIRNGSVVSVEKERVIFQIQEYGYAKNIALELFTPNQEER